jgi:signal transduction histidine kinase
MFNRLETQYEGTGIGITIVRKAAERMGGKVGLEWTPGEGTRFWIQLKPASLDATDTHANLTPVLSHAGI